MIVEIALVVLSMMILNKWGFKQIDKEKETFEKVLYSIFIVITNIFLIIYYIDRLNLPTKLKISDNVDTQNWLIVITSLYIIDYISSYWWFNSFICSK